MQFKQLQKLKKGDTVAVLSTSWAGPAIFPHVFDLGLQRMKNVFGLQPVEYPTTRKINASTQERTVDLIAAFENTSIKAVFASIGGDDQVTYIKNLPSEPFFNNPKPFFGYSDNTHFMNHLWLNGVPSFYGGAVMTQFAMQKRMDEYTVNLLKTALFEKGEFELKPSDTYNDIGLEWGNQINLDKERIHEQNEGWFWNIQKDVQGVTWGGCLESIDEMMRHNISLPTLDQFESIVLFTETSEEIPSSDYVARVYRALGERGILERVQAVLVGRPKAWEFDNQKSKDEKQTYRADQRTATVEAIRKYNTTIPVVQNLDFGHTDPQIPFPNGKIIRLAGKTNQIFVNF